AADGGRSRRGGAAAGRRSLQPAAPPRPADQRPDPRPGPGPPADAAAAGVAGARGAGRGSRGGGGGGGGARGEGWRGGSPAGGWGGGFRGGGFQGGFPGGGFRGAGVAAQLLQATRQLYPTSDAGTWEHGPVALLTVAPGSAPVTLVRAGQGQMPQTGGQLRLG